MGRLAVREASPSFPSKTRTEESQELFSHYGERVADCWVFSWTLWVLWMCQQVACMQSSLSLHYPGFLASWLTLSYHRPFIECVSFLVFYSTYAEGLTQHAQVSMRTAEKGRHPFHVWDQLPAPTLLSLSSGSSSLPTSSTLFLFKITVFWGVKQISYLAIWCQPWEKWKALKNGKPTALPLPISGYSIDGKKKALRRLNVWNRPDYWKATDQVWD